MHIQHMQRTYMRMHSIQEKNACARTENSLILPSMLSAKALVQQLEEAVLVFGDNEARPHYLQ